MTDEPTGQDLVDEIVSDWRDAHPTIEQLWEKLWAQPEWQREDNARALLLAVLDGFQHSEDRYSTFRKRIEALGK